jgi:glutathione peroxidase
MGIKPALSIKKTGMKTAHIIIALLVIAATLPVAAQTKTLHDFTVTDIKGEPYDLSLLKGKKVLVVNVASKCGLTPQYEQLQELYGKYEAQDFVVIGFPCNDFKGQEPGSPEEIVAFCETNYGVTFPLMGKVSVLGESKDPVYKWLTEKSENGKTDAEIKWNFQKFMIDEDGQLVDVLLPQAGFYEKVAAWVEGNR